jgi:6-phosphogluconolactonase/glucosamine-6-phosphate isomerase/deaminase
MKKLINDCLNIVAENVTVSPLDFDNLDEFVDTYMDDAKSVYGKMNAAMFSSVEKMARDGWQQYYDLETDK